MKKGIVAIALMLLVAMLTMTACGPTTEPPTPDEPGTGDQPGTGEQPGGDDPTPTEKPTLYLVGDSTVCAFTDAYYYPRYGYGTQLPEYLTDGINVVNLALSGRSSKSFTTEANYQTLLDSLKAGDYLLISFGHNDQKDEADRFTDASKDHTDPTSFGYHLYEYYVKVAQEKGATPILVTPIVRADSDDDYTGSEGHITATGDYRQAILDLATAKGVAVIDMTTITREEYEAIGYDEAVKYHAVTKGKYDTDGTTVIADMVSVDKTHLNIYGAKYVAYRLAGELAKIDGIKVFVKETLTAPTEADLVPLEGYVVPDYMAPNLEAYEPATHFVTTTAGWYGTAFGNTGGNPQSASNEYVATETSTGVYKVGCTKEKGKFEGGSDGFAFLFTQLDADTNFTITVNAKILNTTGVKQAGFGLMLRDDCIIDQNDKGTISTNYATAGVLANSASEMRLNFYRRDGELKKDEHTLDGIYAVDDTFTLTLTRDGDTITATVVYNGETYETEVLDLTLNNRDKDYIYIGMFANRGTVVEFSNVQLTIND